MSYLYAVRPPTASPTLTLLLVGYSIIFAFLVYHSQRSCNGWSSHANALCTRLTKLRGVDFFEIGARARIHQQFTARWRKAGRSTDNQISWLAGRTAQSHACSITIYAFRFAVCSRNNSLQVRENSHASTMHLQNGMRIIVFVTSPPTRRIPCISHECERRHHAHETWKIQS